MRWLAVMAASVVVHGAILASLPSRDHARPPVPPPVVEIELSPAPEAAAEPVAIEFVTLPVEPVIAPAAIAPLPGTPYAIRGTSVRGTSPPGAEVPEAPQLDAPPAPGTGALSMRDRPPGAETRARPQIPVPYHRGKYADLADQVLAMAPQELPPPPPTSGELEAQKDGTYVKHDSVYTATVNPDGTVDFDDKANFNYKFHVPNPRKIVKGVGEHIAGWAEDPYGVATGASKKKRHEGPNAEDDDGDAKADEGETVTILSGGFDVTDAVMRWMGDDPYNAKKAAFLERTRDARVEIGQQHRARQLADTEKFVLGHLKRLWRRDDLSVEARRAGVFELWDDCAETGEDAIVDAGTRARAAVLRFIAVHLPEGSADAFTADEVAAFNADRRSKNRFAPY